MCWEMGNDQMNWRHKSTTIWNLQNKSAERLKNKITHTHTHTECTYIGCSFVLVHLRLVFDEPTLIVAKATEWQNKRLATARVRDEERERESACSNGHEKMSFVWRKIYSQKECTKIRVCARAGTHSWQTIRNEKCGDRRGETETEWAHEAHVS